MARLFVVVVLALVVARPCVVVVARARASTSAARLSRISKKHIKEIPYSRSLYPLYVNPYWRALGHARARPTTATARVDDARDDDGKIGA